MNRAIQVRLPLVFAVSVGAAPVVAMESSPPAAEPPRNVADRMRDGVDNALQRTVNRVDSFFATSDESTFNERKNRLRLRLETDYLQHHGWDVSPKLKLHVVLPGLNERLRLVINDAQGSDDAETATDEEDNDVALRWVGRQSAALGYSFDVGLRLKSGHLDPFVRANVGTEYELARKWVGQTTNRLYYYSRTGWRNDFRQYFNRGIDDDLLLRSRTRVQYFAQYGYNPFFEQKFSLYQSLSDTRKLAWEVLYRKQTAEMSPFDEDQILGSPRSSYNEFIAQLRYRQQFWRPWFYVEFWPVVGWPEERNYDTTLAFRFRVEINVGSTGDQRLDE